MTQPNSMPWKALVIAVLISIAVAALRFLGQVQGWITTSSGGGLHPVGVVWLPFLFGPVFAARLARSGSAPRMRRSSAIGVVGLLLIVGVVIWQFAPIADLPGSDPAAKEATNKALFASFVATLVVFAVHAASWWKLALTMICYAVPVRLAVIALTAIAKQMDYDTHYTKFGPSGEQFDLATTLTTASIAQLGFWVPFAVVCGFATGSFFGPKPKPQA
jgi:hypothetical protein